MNPMHRGGAGSKTGNLAGDWSKPLAPVLRLTGNAVSDGGEEADQAPIYLSPQSTQSGEDRGELNRSGIIGRGSRRKMVWAAGTL
jgi:hypothetical protein